MGSLQSLSMASRVDWRNLFPQGWASWKIINLLSSRQFKDPFLVWPQVSTNKSINPSQEVGPRDQWPAYLAWHFIRRFLPWFLRKPFLRISTLRWWRRHFWRFFRDNFRPEVVSDVISVGLDVPVKFGDSRSSRSRIIWLLHVATNDGERMSPVVA